MQCSSMGSRSASAKHQGAPKLYGRLNPVLEQKDDSRVNFTSLPPKARNDSASPVHQASGLHPKQRGPQLFLFGWQLIFNLRKGSGHQNAIFKVLQDRQLLS